MRRAALVLLSLVMAAPALAKKPRGKAAAARADALEHRENARRAVAAGDEATAAIELEKSIALDARDPIAQHELGKIRFKQGKLPEAIKRFQAAVKLDPKNWLAWYNLAYASRKAERFERAVEAYRQCLALAPDEVDAHYGLAESLRQSGDSAGAVAAYRQYIDKEARPGEQQWVQRSRERIAELEEGPRKAAAAREAALQAAAAKVAAEKAQREKAAALKVAAEEPAAERAAPPALKPFVVPLPPEAAKAAAAPPPEPVKEPAKVGAANQKEPDEAEARRHYIAAVELINQKQYAPAVAELDQALAAHPAYAVALIARGSARIGLQQYNEAVADYTAARQAAPAMAAPIIGLAEALRALGQREKAAKLYREFAASSAGDATEPLKAYARRNAELLSKR